MGRIGKGSGFRSGAAGRHPIQIAAIWAERYAPVRRATWIGSPLCRRLLLFLFCYFSLRVVPASKQSLAEHVIQHPDVMRQNCRPKTKLDALLCAQISASNKTVFFLKSNLKFLRGTPWRNILKNWLFLATAIISEVIATSALKSSEGFTRLVPSFIVVAGYAAAFYFLSLTLKSIPVGIAYAVWSGLGIVLVTAIAWVLHGQKLDMWGFVGVGFIISGVAVLNLLSKASVH